MLGGVKRNQRPCRSGDDAQRAHGDPEQRGEHDLQAGHERVSSGEKVGSMQGEASGPAPKRSLI